MAPRIIDRARPHSADEMECGRLPASRPTLVIADSGAMVELLLFPSDEPVDRGSRFRYRGAVWEITGRRDSGILAAEPRRQ